MEKRNSIKPTSINLLKSREYLSALRFEAGYANSVRGGHLPCYFTNEKKQRLVNSVNILSSAEREEIIYGVFISQN